MPLTLATIVIAVTKQTSTAGYGAEKAHTHEGTREKRVK